MADKKNKKVAPAQLFDKFGEFGSAEELNRAAKAQLNEGDIEALKILAKENGIDEYDTEDFIAGDIEELATPLTAALGRIKVEQETLGSMDKEKAGPCRIIASIALTMMDDEEVVAAVMQKGKRIEGIDKVMYKERCLAGTDSELKDIIKAYYTKGEDAATEVCREIKKRYC